jgi:hypothetical protein
MSSQNKQVFQHRLYLIKSSRGAVDAATRQTWGCEGFQDQKLEVGTPIRLPETRPPTDTSAEPAIEVTYHMRPPSHVLQAIHQLAALRHEQQFDPGLNRQAM